MLVKWKVYDVDKVDKHGSRRQGKLLGEAATYKEAAGVAKGDVQWRPGMFHQHDHKWVKVT